MPRRFVSMLAQFNNRQSRTSGMPSELSASVVPQGQLASVTVPIGCSGFQSSISASCGMGGPTCSVTRRYSRSVANRRLQLEQTLGNCPSKWARIHSDVAKLLQWQDAFGEFKWPRDVELLDGRAVVHERQK